MYPRSEDWSDRFALVCWPCDRVRRRGEEWQAINLKKHKRQWAAERREWNDD